VFELCGEGTEEGTRMSTEQLSIHELMDLIEKNGSDRQTTHQEATRLIQYIQQLLSAAPMVTSAEEKTAWDGYVCAMLQSSPGLHIETAVNHANGILENRRRKFGSNS
jgi:transposase